MRKRPKRESIAYNGLQERPTIEHQPSAGMLWTYAKTQNAEAARPPAKALFNTTRNSLDRYRRSIRQGVAAALQETSAVKDTARQAYWTAGSIFLNVAIHTDKALDQYTKRFEKKLRKHIAPYELSMRTHVAIGAEMISRPLLYAGKEFGRVPAVASNGIRYVVGGVTNGASRAVARSYNLLGRFTSLF